MERRPAIDRIAAGFVGALAWSAVALQMTLVLEAAAESGRPPIPAILTTLSYFTILTNLWVAAVATASALRPDAGTALTRAGTMTATAIYIFVVGLIYALLLRALSNPTGLALVADDALHDVVPAAYLLYWAVFVPKGTLRWAQAVFWLGYPLAYMMYTLLRGAFTGRYPYPFADVTALGYPTVLANAVLFLIGFFVTGLAAVRIDGALGGARARRRGTETSVAASPTQPMP